MGLDFDGAKVAREYEELTAGWPPLAKQAYDMESLEKTLWAFRPQALIRQFRANLRGMSSALSGVRLPDVEPEEFRRSSRFPNHLYVLAHEARAGGKYSDYAVFLRALDLEASGDLIIAADERLRITFEPKGNNTRAWWFDASDRAREWLRHQLVKPNTGIDARGPELNPELISPEDKHKALHKVLEPELHEFMLRELLHRTLPQRQAEVIWLYIMFHDSDRPRETTAAIAEHLQISPATVRWHKAQALENPELRKIWRRA
jgi:hypothetical protein